MIYVIIPICIYLLVGWVQIYTIFKNDKIILNTLLVLGIFLLFIVIHPVVVTFYIRDCRDLRNDIDALEDEHWCNPLDLPHGSDFYGKD